AHGIKPDGSWYGASQLPSLHLASELGEKMVELYDNKEVSEVYIVYTEYVNSAVQKPVCRRVLPLLRRDFDDVEYENKYETEVIYEPDIQTVFDQMVPQYIVGMMYDVIMQSAASENAARMTAMQNATKNADKMTAKLSEQINAVRQLVITNEITEIAAATQVQENGV
ncbi:MAG TPA: F0F1 ATP synthase subunit gamma, partial [Ruminococcaceae bacterium]|nr:F0F1 ATP synthase subunit gamma [Oscillospiraceae bacterium]